MFWNAYAINVLWYIQRVAGLLEYGVETNPSIVDHMYQSYGSTMCVPTPQTCCSNWMDMFGLLPVRVNLQPTEGSCYRREFGNMWLVDEKIRDDVAERADLC